MNQAATAIQTRFHTLSGCCALSLALIGFCAWWGI